MKRRYKYPLRLFVMLVAVLLFLKWVNISAGISHLKTVSPALFGLALFIILVANLIKGIRFHILTDALGLGLGWVRTLLVNSMFILVGRFTPGRVGEGLKIVMLEGKNTDLSFCFVMEKVVDSILVLLIAVLGIGVLIGEGTLGDFINSYLLFGTIIAILVVMLFNIDRIIRLVIRRDVLEKRWFWINLRKLNLWHWFWFITISLCIRALALLMAVLVIEMLHIEASWILVMVLWNLAIIVGQVSALPGGFGAREAGFTGLLSSYAAISKELAGVAAVLVTLVDLIVESFLAVTCWVLLKLFFKD